jgi:hypothetical protein
MPQGSRGLWRAVGAHQIALAARVTYRTPARIRSTSTSGFQQVENFVDNRLPRSPNPAAKSASYRLASKTGSKKLSKINELDSVIVGDRVGTVHGPNVGAAVELSARANRRCVDG